jgi:hypothetical protein
MRLISAGMLAALLVLVPIASGVSSSSRAMDGRGNNAGNPSWGEAGTQYIRVAPANYADGVAKPVSGPNTRYISNRIFNDRAQNLFSENNVSQWGFVWGQFMDHTFGLRQEVGGEDASIAFNARDPLEEFTNTLGVIPFTRTPAAPGTGVTSVRQQINTVSSYIDGSSVYGDAPARLEWLREGPYDGTLSDNGGRLLLDHGYLPRRDARGDAATAPEMALMGRLAATPSRAMVAGDTRANENIALTATHTLFAREHNRIVDALPRRLSEETKFQIARRIVGAEQQYITYNEFLPALGVELSPYQGYKANVDATLSNEFAVVGYRAHSMIHGQLEPIAPAGTYSPAQVGDFEQEGIAVEDDAEEGASVVVVPLNVAFGNPDLLPAVGLGPVLRGIGSEPQYKNDELIDNQLRSTLFEIPVSGNPTCLDGPTLPACFKGVVDLGAIDVERGRDHGMPLYNALRAAYGLAPNPSFTSITGEATDRFPAGNGRVNRTDPIDDPDSLDFVKVFDADGKRLPLGTEEGAVLGIRRTTLAARLKAIYGNVAKLDAFVGMVSERHIAGTEFGELQLAIWKKQFEALRDGDRFFYANDPELAAVCAAYGLEYRYKLSQIIRMNSDAQVADDVFVAGE